MKLGTLLCLTLLVFSIAPQTVAEEAPPTCTPVGPCVPLQREYDDLVGNNLQALGSANVGWLNLDPGNIRFQPLLDLPPVLVASAASYAISMADLAQGTAAAASEAPGSAEPLSTWVLGVAGEVPGRAGGSALAIANAGDAAVVVAVSESGAWVSFVNSAGVTLASSAVSLATSTPSSAATAQRAALGGPDYLERKALQAAETLVEYLADPPAGAVQRDVDENGLGDTWEDAVCRSRFGAPGLPPDACEAVGGAYHMGRSYATFDFDEDGLGLIDEYRWNSDPLDPDTDGDGLPDGPETHVWRRSENDLVMHANLWTCPSSIDADSCAWRHPDSFRDDDGDGRYNIGQDPTGPLAALGAGDADSENDGLMEGDEYYGCHANPAYGHNAHADPRVPDFAICSGNAQRGHETDPTEPDTDGDGLRDIEEVCSAAGGACSRQASYDTDPLALDTDGDAWTDGDEAAFWRTHEGWFNDIDADGIQNNLADPDSDRDGMQDGIEDMQGLRPDRWDTDLDGMPDPWEIWNRLDPNFSGDAGPTDRACDRGSVRDPDSDGLCNSLEYGLLRPTGWDEWTQGPFNSPLSPHDPDFDGDGLPDGDEVFPNAVDAAYMERYALQPPGTPGTIAGRYYYRWDAKHPGFAGSTRVDVADSDGDGIPDNTEVRQATRFGSHSNPNSADSDLDSLADRVEQGTDPALWDSDGDSVADGSEEVKCQQTTDCDNDGLSDGEEIDPANGCNPSNPDTDGDGLLDGWEVHGTTPGDSKGHHTRCDEEDSDGDTFNDRAEILVYAIDPNQQDSDGDGLRDDDEVNGLLNAAHSAHHQARGNYSFGSDRCVSPNPNRCTQPGSTDPGEPDSDGDGLLDGAEVHGVYKSNLCQGEFCPLWHLNPNQADTDGDNPPGATTFNDYNERFRRSAYNLEQLAYPPYDPSDYDPDHDGFSDSREFDAGTDPFNWDTDHDRLSDGAEAAEGGFNSDPRKANTDSDSTLDFFDPEIGRDNDPPLLLSWHTLEGDARKGTCLAAADLTTVTFNVHRWVEHHTHDPTGAVPDQRFPTNDTFVVLPTWTNFNGVPHACLDYRASPLGSNDFAYVSKAEVTMTDVAGNSAIVTFDTYRNGPAVDGWTLAEQILCYVPFAGAVYSMAIHVGETMEYAQGLAEFTLDTLELDGIPVPQGAKMAFKAIGTVMCVIDNIVYVAKLGTSTWQATAAVETNEVAVHTFTMRDGIRAHLLRLDGHAFAAHLADGSTFWRGSGYPFLQSKHASGGWTEDQWRSKLTTALSSGSYSDECNGTSICYRVIQANLDGVNWTVYVYKNAIADVELA